MAGSERIARGEIRWCQGLIRDVPTVRELVDRVIAEAERIIDQRRSEMTGRLEAATA